MIISYKVKYKAALNMHEQNYIEDNLYQFE